MCFYCDKSNKLQQLMIPVIELAFSNVYLNRDQKHKGRCIVALKEHKTEYFQLSAEQNAGYFAEVSLVAEAIQNLYQPNKINYATFGDLVPHVHMHIVPKYEGRLQWGKAFNDDVPKELLGEAEYQKIVGELKGEITKLSSNVNES